MSNTNTNPSVTVVGNTITLSEPVIVNGTTYNKFEMKVPSYSEVLANYDAIEKAGTMTGQIAVAKLTKLCITNMTKTSDFDALPFRVVMELELWVGKHFHF